MLQVIQLASTDVCQEGGGGGWLSDNRMEDIEVNVIIFSIFDKEIHIILKYSDANDNISFRRPDL